MDLLSLRFLSKALSLKILFFNSLNFCSAANALPLPTTVESISTLYFLFSSNIFFYLSFWSVFVLFFDLFFFLPLPYKKLPFCLQQVFQTSSDKHIPSDVKRSTNKRQYFGSVADFLKYSRFPTSTCNSCQQNIFKRKNIQNE